MSDESVYAKTETPAPDSAGLRRVTVKTVTGVHLDANAAARRSRPGAEDDPYIGATIDERYEVEALLGLGGMGAVYRCRHTIIGKKVAMKVLLADLARNDEVVERFLNEARAASSIGNAHIIDISDFGRLPDGTAYFIMEYLDGQPLSSVLDEGPLDEERAGRITMQLAEGLRAAHGAGIVHRDLKPDNIYLIERSSQQDFVKILDFGIAKVNNPGTKLTQAGQVFGTPHYMSPEQASGAEVDLRSDVYALGVILYEMATGQLPFDAENYMGILTQHMYKDPPPPSTLPGLVRPVSPDLEQLILHCLKKNADDRFQSMEELGASLEALFGPPLRAGSRFDAMSVPDFARVSKVRDGDAVAATVSPPPEKKKTLPLVLGGVALAAAATLAFYFVSRSEPTAALAPAPPAAAASSEPAPTPPSTAQPAPAEPTPAPEPIEELVSVAVAVSPLTAHVFDGDQDLGASPVMLDVGQEPRSLTAKLPGYQDLSFSVDGTRTKLSVEMQPVPKPRVQRRPVKQTAPKTTTSTDPPPAPTKAPPRATEDDGLEDPWN